MKFFKVNYEGTIKLIREERIGETGLQYLKDCISKKFNLPQGPNKIQVKVEDLYMDIDDEDAMEIYFEHYLDRMLYIDNTRATEKQVSQTSEWTEISRIVANLSSMLMKFLDTDSQRSAKLTEVQTAVVDTKSVVQREPPLLDKVAPSKPPLPQTNPLPASLEKVMPTKASLPPAFNPPMPSTESQPARIPKVPDYFVSPDYFVPSVSDGRRMAPVSSLPDPNSQYNPIKPNYSQIPQSYSGLPPMPPDLNPYHSMRSYMSPQMMPPASMMSSNSSGGYDRPAQPDVPNPVSSLPGMPPMQRYPPQMGNNLPWMGNPQYHAYHPGS